MDTGSQSFRLYTIERLSRTSTHIDDTQTELTKDHASLRQETVLERP